METRGDSYNCPCPHCGKINNYVAHGIEVPFRKIVAFCKPCSRCRLPVHYKAQWEVQIVAATEPEIVEAEK